MTARAMNRKLGRLILLPLLLMVAAFGANAQSVYKCKDASGTTIFSQRPCSSDPAQVQSVDVSRSLKSGTGGAVAEQGEFSAMNEVQRRCTVREADIAERYRARNAQMSQQIAGLERRLNDAANNLAGATMESGIRQQIAGLITARSSLIGAEAQEMQSAREQCDSQTASEEKRIDSERKARERAERKAAAVARDAAEAKAAEAAKQAP